MSGFLYPKGSWSSTTIDLLNEWTPVPKLFHAHVKKGIKLIYQKENEALVFFSFSFLERGMHFYRQNWVQISAETLQCYLASPDPWSFQCKIGLVIIPSSQGCCSEIRDHTAEALHLRCCVGSTCYYDCILSNQVLLLLHIQLPRSYLWEQDARDPGGHSLTLCSLKCELVPLELTQNLDTLGSREGSDSTHFFHICFPDCPLFFHLTYYIYTTTTTPTLRAFHVTWQVKLKSSNFTQAVIFIHSFIQSVIHSKVCIDADPPMLSTKYTSVDKSNKAPAIRAYNLIGIAGSKQVYVQI